MTIEYSRYNIGDIINGRYRVLSLFPEGGMGIVVRVLRLKDKRELALKYCRYNDDENRRRFSREVRAMQGISHPNVMAIVAKSLKHDPPYFTMEIAEGSLEEELQLLAANENAAIAAFLEISAGIQAIHNADAVHRDIKPANALRMENKTICVADLGLAKFAQRDTTVLTQTRAVVGTDRYLAPEQRLPDGSRNADKRTDVYQLGKTLYQLLTGREPILMDLTKVPSGLAHIIKKATRDNPDDRYQDMGKMIDAVIMYQKIKDPAAKPVDAFEGLLATVEARSARGTFLEEEVVQLLVFLDRIGAEDDELFAELLEKLPDSVLATCASLLHEQFDGILKRYVRILHESAGGEPFSYADTVSRKMKCVFEATNSDDLALMALQAVLIVAVDLNRFSAMSTLDTLLLSIQDDGRAMATAELLEHQRKRYAMVADRIPAAKLHPAIRAIREQVIPPKA